MSTQNRTGQVWRSEISDMTMIVVGDFDDGHLVIVIYEGKTSLTNVAENKCHWETYKFLRRLV
jgi:hypothetical protein